MSSRAWEDKCYALPFCLHRNVSSESDVEGVVDVPPLYVFLV